jgi:hypothetical protein
MQRSRYERLAVVAAAAAILFFRMPYAFKRPQFWAEDAVVFLDNYLRGIHAIFEPAAGYMIVTSRLIAYFAGFFPIWLAPWLYNYMSLAITLAVVCLVMSPRLQVPYKPLLALAVVVVPAGYEVLMSLCNAQWITPIGVIAIFFMRPSGSHLVQALEYIFVALVGMTGPFAWFLCPISIFIYFQDKTHRRLIFALIMIAASLVQIPFMVFGPESVTNMMPSRSYDWTLWVTTPLRKFVEVFTPFHLIINGSRRGLLLLVAALPLVSWLLIREPYRWLKLSAAAFSMMVFYAGMLKYRGDLTFMEINYRYAFAGSIFFIWLLCLNAVTLRPLTRYAVVLLVVFAEINSFRSVRSWEKITKDLHWSEWAEKIAIGAPATVPISPNWTMRINSTQSKILRP